MLAKITTAAIIAISVTDAFAQWNNSGTYWGNQTEIRFTPRRSTDPSEYVSTLDTPFMKTLGYMEWFRLHASGDGQGVWGSVGLFDNGSVQEMRSVNMLTGTTHRITYLPAGDFRSSFYDFTTNSCLTYDNVNGRMGRFRLSQSDFDPNAVAVFMPYNTSILPGPVESLSASYGFNQQTQRYFMERAVGLCNIEAATGGVDYRTVSFNSQGDLLSIGAPILPGRRLSVLRISFTFGVQDYSVIDSDTGTLINWSPATGFTTAYTDTTLVGVRGYVSVPSSSIGIAGFGIAGFYACRRRRTK